MEDYAKETLMASPYPFWITMLIFVGISALINYLIVYSKEKARRKVEEKTATKITDKVESVKSAFTAETEKLKANLTLLTSIQHGIVSEERNAIIEFVKSLYNLENSIFKTPLKITDNKAIEREIENMDNANYHLKCNQALFNLYIEDNKLKIKAIELIKEISKIENVIQKSYREITLKNIGIKLIKEEKCESTKEKRDEMNKAFQEIQKIYNSAQHESTRIYSSYIKNRTAFENECRTRIYQLVEPEH